MNNIKSLLAQRVSAALDKAGTPGDAIVQVAGKPEFGDYQANGVMGAAKRNGRNPRELAGEVLAQLELADVAQDVSIAGPGFLNITLSQQFLRTQLAHLKPAQQSQQRVVVDYSSPNLAKEMHVGHLRSTIIGDAVVRVLEALGHQVIRQNHVGDWGTQFGMLLRYLNETGATGEALADLETFYREAKARFDADPQFASQARETVVALQSGDADALAAWRRFIDVSLSHCQALYDRLGVSLSRSDVQAESAYNEDLPRVLADLASKGLLTVSDGAQCVFLDEFKGKDGAPQPVIVQKSDGGYLYATTDLSAVRYRASTLKADRVMVFTDARQVLHFRQIFAVSRSAGFAPENMVLEHMPFGAMLGADGKPFKTRTGGVIKLAELLDEAEARALALVEAKNPDLTEEERREIARVVGIGAVKYADLSKNRTSDYVFDWDQMLSFDGNTAPYLQYAVARVHSIFRRAGLDAGAYLDAPLPLAPAEHQLAVGLLRFQETLEAVAAEGMPHYLCSHLYDLASRFTRFYEQCPVLTAESQRRDDRLRFCALTAHQLSTGLALLGIETVEKM